MYLRERPTPQQWQIATWIFIVALAGMGTVGLWYGFQTRAEKADIGEQLKAIGIAGWVTAIGLWGVKRGVEAALA
jgi:hypothetical protein